MDLKNKYDDNDVTEKRLEEIFGNFSSGQRAIK